MQPQRISILGVGLLGGSIGLAVRSRINGCRIVGYGHRESTIHQAIKIGALDEGYVELGPAVRGADLIVLCTPVGLFRSLLAALAPLVTQKTLITDVGSTKRSIVADAGQLLPPGARFVGSHPMAGSEKRGVEYARADLYEAALCILTPTAHTDPSAVAAVEQFWKTLGMRTCRLSPEEHDRRLADVSHLPHALSAALVSIQEMESTPLAGKGFHDMTRIAGGDGGLWRDILLDNRDHVTESISRLQAELEMLKSLLHQHDGDALRKWLDDAAARRQALLEGLGR